MANTLIDAVPETQDESVCQSAEAYSNGFWIIPHRIVLRLPVLLHMLMKGWVSAKSQVQSAAGLASDRSLAQSGVLIHSGNLQRRRRS